MNRRVLVGIAALAAWAGEVALAGAIPGGQLSGALAVEGLGWAGLAAALLVAPDDWRGSPAWPAAVGFGAGWARTLPVSPQGLPEIAGLAGVIVVSVVAVRVLDDLLRRAPALLGVVTVAAVAGARLLGLASAGAGAAEVARELAGAGPFLGIAVAAGLATLPGALRVVGALGVLGSVVAAWWRPPLPQAAADAPIVLITVDTLRWDDARTMRSVARLAARGSSWERASSTASWTLPALASLHTGLYPDDHGAGVRPGPRPVPIGSDVPTLAERLAARGHATGCFVENAFTSSELGFSRGCGAWFHAAEAPPLRLAWAGEGPRTHPVDAAIAWLPRAPDRGAFLWVHLVEPHLPYAHLPSSPEDPLHHALDGRFDLLKVTAVRAGMVSLDEPARARLREAYRADVADADARVEALLDAVDARWPDATVVMTADHGEELWDHGGFEHGHSHHTEVVEVPLVIAGGGMPVGPRADRASLIDVVPTLLASPSPRKAERWPGVDLHTPVPPGRYVLADGGLYAGPSLSAWLDDRHAIVGVGEFDLATDPLERSPLPPGPLTEWAIREGGRRATGEAATVPEEGLRALGYLE